MPTPFLCLRRFGVASNPSIGDGVSAKLELYVVRTICKAVRDATGLPTTLQYQGSHADIAAAGTEDWASVTVLSFDRFGSREGQWIGAVLFQVSVFSRFAEARSDAVIDKPWEYASAVRVALEHQELTVKNYGDGTSAIINLKIGEGSPVYISDPTSDSDLANVHGVVMSFRGNLDDR